MANFLYVLKKANFIFLNEAKRTERSNGYRNTNKKAMATATAMTIEWM